MQTTEHDLSVYYDGSCPLCQAEIAHYRRQRRAEEIDFVDVSSPSNDLGPDLDRGSAMARFHVRTKDGTLLSGAEAFARIWEQLPRWRWAWRISQFPLMFGLLEFGYQLFLPMRSRLSRVFGWLTRRGRPEGEGS
ncbi:MAG: thiol-disulfide oxidoreductase DCC family protein [Filomicrobium sp.]